MQKRIIPLIFLCLHSIAYGQTAGSSYTYRYWFDNDTTTLVTGTSPSISFHIDADLSGLSDQLHVFHILLADTAGVWSSTSSNFFCKVPPTASTLTCQLTVDNQLFRSEEVAANGGIVAWTFPVDSLSVGLHSYAVQTVAPDGMVSSIRSGFFLRNATTKELSDMKLCYFLDEDTTTILYAEAVATDSLQHYKLDVGTYPTKSTHTLTCWLVGKNGLTVLPVQTASFAIGRVLVYSVDGIAIVENPDGELDDILQEKELVRVLILTDTVRGGDFAALHNVPNMEELTLPLVNSQKDSIRLGTFDRLLAVTTTDSASVLQDYVFEGATPNLMIYAPTGATVESPGRNIILGGVSESILLTDGYPVLIPVTFTAKAISYTRSFSKQTVIGQSSGWETLALPYQVQTIATQDGRTLVPFGAEQTGDGNFWLAAMGSGGFQAATAIAANTPYILAMPNNEEYTLGNVTGPVTFSATDAEVRSTTGLSPVEGAYIFTPTYRGQGGSGIYAINDEAYQDYLPGGVFVRGLRDVRPFEAYLTLPAGAKQRNVIPVFESEATGMDDVRWSMYDERWTTDDVPGGEAYYDLSGRRIGKPTKTGTYLLKNGKRVQKVWVK